MTKRMLIDASHKEETRVAITDGNRLAEYDYENHSRKPLKGSIFLAKVTRVEPSLQAAFVNFGGNRHGFLPFSEIHPDYFRIPISDREALMAEQEALIKEHDEEEEREDLDLDDHSDGDDHDEEADSEEAEEDFEAAVDGDANGNEEAAELESGSEEDDADNIGNKAVDNDASEDDKNAKNKDSQRRNYRGRGRGRRPSRRSSYRNRNVEVVGGDDVEQEQRFRFNLRRKYKIQEVIKRGQIMLVQANKEERGNKGAAVGTYLSLPGRYCVLMPNSPRGGGVSRKIANQKDRSHMRDIVKSLDVPKGMSVIIRTAGVSRTKTEIKRDLDYLMRLWDSIRALTLESTAPSLVYEEADLIKRAVRDLYTRDVEEVLVFGEEGFKTAKSFMKLMIPSHVKKVNEYKDTQLPLFNRYQIESQISEIGQPEVRLKAGGYLVINPTEALISIDVNSGKATKGRHIEETALKTNLEAADEVARQLRLRDLGGLVVIDFIDMEDRRNNAKVERRMKEALSSDRARVQVGRISSFGLMELSRQRLSPSLTEAQYEKCPKCSGVGIIPSADAMSITVLRSIEEEGIRSRASQVIVCVNNDVALYILNHKRQKLIDIEKRYSFEVLLRVDDKIPACEHRIEVSKPLEKGEMEDGSVSENEEKDVQEQPQAQVHEDDQGSKNGSRRRRGRRTRRKDPNDESAAKDVQEDSGGASQGALADKAEEKEKRPRRARKPRRKPREDVKEDVAEKVATEADGEKQKKAPQRRRTRTPAKDVNKKAGAEKTEEPSSEKVGAVDVAADKNAAKPSAPNATNKEAEEVSSVVKKAPSKKKKVKEPAQEKKDYEVVNQPPSEKKKGWWNRLVD